MKIINQYGDGPDHLDDYDEIEVTTNGEDIVIVEIVGAPDDDGERRKVSCHMPIKVAEQLADALHRAIEAATEYEEMEK